MPDSDSIFIFPLFRFLWSQWSTEKPLANLDFLYSIFWENYWGFVENYWDLVKNFSSLVERKRSFISQYSGFLRLFPGLVERK